MDKDGEFELGDDIDLVLPLLCNMLLDKQSEPNYEGLTLILS